MPVFNPFLFLSAVLCLVSGRMLSQDLPLEELIGVDQGLSQGFVTAIVQDDGGLVWLGTLNGLNKYDGNRFEYFRRQSLDGSDPFPLNNNQVTAIHDMGDYLMLGYARGGGWSFFHKRTRRNHPLPEIAVPGAPILPLAEYKLTTHTIDRDAFGQFWISLSAGDFDFYVVRLQVPEGFPDRRDPNGRNSGWVLDWWRFNAVHAVVDLSMDRRHVAVLLDDEVVGMPVQGQLSWHTCWKLSPSELPLVRCASASLDFFLDAKGRLLPFGDAATGRAPDWKAWLPENTLVIQRQEKELAAVRLSRPGQAEDFKKPIWARADRDGMLVYLFDRMGNLWLSHGANGVLLLNHRIGIFKTFFAQQSVSRPIIATPSGNICWLEKGGLQLLDHRDSLLVDALRTAVKSRNSPYFRWLDRGPDGDYWVAKGMDSTHTELVRIEPTGRVARTYVLPVPYRLIFSFGVDKAGNLFFPSEGSLIHFESATGCWESVATDMLADDATINAVEFTGDGSVWLGMESGLGRYLPGSGVIRPFPGAEESGKHGGLKDRIITDLMADPLDDQVLWIGTRGSGLFRLDVRTGEVSTAMAGILPDGIVYCLLPGSAGKLWLSTNTGLYEYDPARGNYRNFRKHDGLQATEFNTWASGVRYVRQGTDTVRELMFGGVDGLTCFNPEDLQQDDADFGVNVTWLQVNESPVTVGDHTGLLAAAVEYGPSITLPFGQNNVRLEYALSDYSNPATHVYECYLEGLEDPWSHRTNETTAAYFHLPPGKYVFHVRGRNQDDLPSRNTASLAITVLPPWYRTLVAYLSYLLVLGGMVTYYLRLQGKRRQAEKALVLHRHRLETQEREMSHQQQLHQLELDAFRKRLLDRSELADSLQETLSANTTGEETAEIKALRRKLYDATILTPADWEQFQQLFEKVYPGLISSILERCPLLTPAEFRFLLVSKLQFNSEKMATVLGVSASTIKQTRYRLRKKLSQLSVDLDDLLGG